MSQLTTSFYTMSHRIEGELLVKERLAEKLNDSLTDFIELSNARISSLAADATSPAVNWPDASIPKSAILLATLDADEHESRQTRVDKVRAKQGSDVGAIVGSIEIYGTGHLNFSGSATQILTTQLQPFFPVTDATLLLSQRMTENRISTGLALVNRDWVRAFTLG